MSVVAAAARLRDAVNDYPARAPIGPAVHVLDPLAYAWPLHARYAERFAPAGHTVEAVLMGMNPGPWGMAQTGVPFGSPDLVREFLGIDGTITPPSGTHPKRPIHGPSCPRNEVSGQRLWGAIRDAFGAPEAFFARFYVLNYNPLLFQSATGANLTPDKLPKAELAACHEACDAHLAEVIDTLRPRTVIGVGAWATRQAQAVVHARGLGVAVGTVLHPSPASPLANRGWIQAARPQLAALGHPWPE